MLCKSINVWERLSDTKITVYRCFETIPDGKFCIQSQDYYYMDPDTGKIDKKQQEYLDNQFLERIFETDRDSEDEEGVLTYFDSIEEAIEDFKKGW